MVIKALIESWKSNHAAEELYLSFVEMLEMNRGSFDTVMNVLGGEESPDAVEDRVLVADIAINRQERGIRRRLVEHLSMNAEDAVPGGLVLMSVVKDAERLGDYCKNLLEVAQMMDGSISDLRFRKELMDLNDRVTQNFDGTLAAFTQGDGATARDILEDEPLMNELCNRLVVRVARSELPAREAVPTALWIRYQKRINAHLSNICSALVLPVHRIDYRLHYEKAKGAAGRLEALQRGQD